MSLIPRLEAWLRKRYEDALSLHIEASTNLDAEALQRATCIWVAPTTEQPRVGGLLDRDLGTWFKFVEATEPGEIPSLVDLEVRRALTESSQLLLRTGLHADAIDSFGGWTVCLIFLVRADCQSAWERQIQTLRSNSGFTEEIAIDRVLFNDSASLEDCLNSVGIPHLLLATRKLLSLDSSAIESWLSADSQVRELLKRLPGHFHDDATRALAQKMVEELESGSASAGTALPVPASHVLQSIEISNLRNIGSFDLQMDAKVGVVSANIIHGPNGTGKSSLFEAMSLGALASSRRLATYLADSDMARKTSGTYVSEVLTPLDSDATPVIRAQGFDLLRQLASSADEANAALVRGDGSFLAQHDAREFVNMPSSELGSRVLRGYSPLAQALQSYCEKEYSVANADRQSWLRKFNIAASITKEETRQSRLIDHFIERDVPRASQHTMQWLQMAASRLPDIAIESKSLATRWQEVDDTSRRQALTLRLSGLFKLGFEQECEKALGSWIEERNSALTSIAAYIEKVQSRLQVLSSQRAEVLQDLEKWWRWAISKTVQTPQSPTAENSGTEIRDLQVELKALAAKGTSLGAHAQHLSQVTESFLRQWAEHHPDRCPTCGDIHHDVDGILGVVGRLRNLVTHEVQEARAEYAVKLKKLRTLEKEQPLGTECPLTHERRQDLIGILGRTEADPESYEQELKGHQSFDSLSRGIDVLLTPPVIEIQPDSRIRARETWAQVSSENAKGAVLWDLPSRWAQIRDAVNKESMAIVKAHLPNTLESVWGELALVMTPARWNLAGRPVMQAETKRGNERLQVVVSSGGRSIQVRHVFNEAENHILGLAWFFTRYLSHGRFERPLIVLDDPAQEMDQTTFRALTRWIQTLCRLHRRAGLSLNLTLFLHQEDRALDAARATDQRLISLRWAKRISSQTSVEHIILVDPSFKTPLPAPLLLPVQVAGA